MTRDQIIDLLSVAAAFDQRTVGEFDVIAWSAALRDSGFEASREAIIAHYREQTRRVMAADIRQHIRQDSRPDSVPFAELPTGTPDEPNEDYLKARDELVAATAARDRLAMAATADASERASSWLDRHLTPGKPAGPAANVPPAAQFAELPGDPPELRAELAALRRGETAGAQ